MDLWNRCDVCGRFIGLDDFESGKAIRVMETPDSHFTSETWETLCSAHAFLLLDPQPKEEP